MIQIDLYELKNICKDMAELGAAADQAKRDPVGDRLKQREVKRWFRQIGENYALLDEFVQKGIVRRMKAGTAPNSPVYYSKYEIQTALNATKMTRYVNKE